MFSSWLQWQKHNQDEEFVWIWEEFGLSEPTESSFAKSLGVADLVQKYYLLWFIFCFDWILSYKVGSIVEYI